MLKRCWLPALLLLASCGTPPQPATNTPPANEGGQKPPANTGGLSHSQEEAERFIRRYGSLSVGLVNYFDNERVQLISREFSAETVVFRLDSTGDTGALHEAAAERAVELMDEFGWPQAAIENEWAPETHLALVRIESIGIPAGSQRGDAIPVRIVLMGDARDIRGGYVYSTPLKNKSGRVVAVLKPGYLPLKVDTANPDPNLTPEQIEDARLMERRETGTGVNFLLRKGVHLAADISADDLTADQIRLPLEIEETNHKGDVTMRRPLTAELVPDALRSIEAEMQKLGQPCEAREDGKFIVVTPLGVREQSLQQVMDRLREIKIVLTPRDSVLVVFDENLFRVAFYGPPRHRFLTTGFALTTDPFTRDPAVYKQPHPLAFRVNCRILQRAEPGASRKYGVPDDADLKAGRKPDGNTGRVRLAWSRWGKGAVVDEGTDELPTTDITEILRHLWARGMGPREVLGFIVEAHDQFAFPCELGFNWRKVDLNTLDSGTTGSGE
ncbi:MAG: flagellar basal body P-ring protein FlgI [Planctomycetes bacterium]|nr:flagellar basal body P-ring protein FlgI [Planctomycetota bacterium]